MRSILSILLDKYRNGSQYKRNVLVMVGGRIFAQTLPILISPILTRLYSPSEFGVFGVYATIVSIVAMLSNGRYCLAIILPKEKETSEKLVGISNILTILTTVLFLVFLLLFGDWFFNILNIAELEQYIWILILNILFIGLYENLFYYVLREKRFKLLAISSGIQALFLVSIRLGAGFWGLSAFGLMLSYLVGYLVAYVLLQFGSGIKLLNIRDLNAKELLRKYVNFPRFSLFTDTLSTLTLTSPNLLLNKVFGSSQAGYFSLSDKVLGSPVWFVTSAVGDVFKQEASEQYRTNGNCRGIFLKTVKTLFLLGIVPFSVIFLFAPYIVPVLFGQEWGPVGDYIRILSIMYFARFVIAPVSDVAYIVNRQYYKTIFEALKLVALVVGILVGSWLGDVLAGLIVWSLLSTVSYAISFFMSFRLASSVNRLEK